MSKHVLEETWEPLHAWIQDECTKGLLTSFLRHGIYLAAQLNPSQKGAIMKHFMRLTVVFLLCAGLLTVGMAGAETKPPATHKGVRITTHRGDFTRNEWPFDKVDGILMANSLHYSEDQEAFIRRCQSRMTAPRMNCLA